MPEGQPDLIYELGPVRAGRPNKPIGEISINKDGKRNVKIY